MPSSQMRQLRHREAKSLPWSLTASVMESGPKQHLAQCLVCQVNNWMRESSSKTPALVSLVVSLWFMPTPALPRHSRLCISLPHLACYPDAVTKSCWKTDPWRICCPRLRFGSSTEPGSLSPCSGLWSCGQGRSGDWGLQTPFRHLHGVDYEGRGAPPHRGGW